MTQQTIIKFVGYLDRYSHHDQAEIKIRDFQDFEKSYIEGYIEALKDAKKQTDFSDR